MATRFYCIYGVLLWGTQIQVKRVNAAIVVAGMEDMKFCRVSVLDDPHRSGCGHVDFPEFVLGSGFGPSNFEAFFSGWSKSCIFNEIGKTTSGSNRLGCSAGSSVVGTTESLGSMNVVASFCAASLHV